jgi:hypothetical protein
VTLRTEAFCRIYPEGDYRVDPSRRHEFEVQKHKTAEHMNAKISELADLMNKMEVYPTSPSEMGHILHTYGINLKNLQLVYSQLSQPYVKAIFKTEAAARSFRMVYSKKMQDSAWNSQGGTAEVNSLELLNALLGQGDDHQQIWRVVSMQSQTYFKMSVSPEEINKGYFLLALGHRLNLELFPAFADIDMMFRSVRFLDGLRC